MSEHNNNGGKSHIYTTQSLGEKGLKAQSAVSLAAGSLDSFEEDEKNRDKNVNKSKKRKKKKARRPEQNKSQGQNKQTAPRRKPVNSKNTLEERLAYYKEKYGEEFRPVDVAEVSSN